MRAVVLGPIFGLEHLKVEDRPQVMPSAGEVLIRMSAASLNFRDLLMVRGHYNPRQSLPLVPCSDGVGRVEAVGPGVSEEWMGKRVCPIFAREWLKGPFEKRFLKSTGGGPLDGTLQEWLCCSVSALVEPPAFLTDEEAACLPCAGVTAYRALAELGDLQPGQRVLLQGTGGVSLFALKIAKALGAQVAMTSSRDERLRKVKELGADFVVNYRTEPQWGRVAKAWTDGAGFDHIVEVGGGKTLEQSLQAVGSGGNIHVIGVLSGVKAELVLTRLLMHQVRLQGVFVGSRETFLALNDLVTAKRLRPLVDQCFPLASIREAFEYLAGGHHMGKVVIQLDEGSS